MPKESKTTKLFEFKADVFNGQTYTFKLKIKNELYDTFVEEFKYFNRLFEKLYDRVRKINDLQKITGEEVINIWKELENNEELKKKSECCELAYLIKLNMLYAYV